MNPHLSPSGITESHKTLVQVEAYLSYNLDIATQLIDATRTRLSDLETQLATPAAQGRARKALKNRRSRVCKKLRQGQVEAEVLVRALDEVQSKIALSDCISAEMEQRRLSVYAQPNYSSYISSPVESARDRMSSISSYTSSGSLSIPASPYAANAPFAFPLPTAVPYMHTNLPMITTHNLPSAPLCPMTPYPVSPLRLYLPMHQQHIPGLWSSVTEPVWFMYPSTYLSPVEPLQPLIGTLYPLTVLPPDTTTWPFQQSHTSDINTVIVPNPSPKTRRYSTAATVVDMASAPSKSKKIGHRRGVSCHLEEVIRVWDEGTTIAKASSVQ
jgi:hypothetical protein